MVLLKGKVALITGTNRGIGKAILSVFAENQAEIWAHARSQTEVFSDYCATLADQYQTRVTPIYFELTDDVQIKEGFKHILNTSKQLDILVNNAGIVGENRSFQMTAIEQMQHVFEVNFFSVMKVTQYALRAMTRRQAGSIVNIASVAGLDGAPAQSEYVGSKAALIGATKKLSLEFGQTGIRVNAVAPGITHTDMLEGMRDDVRSDTLRRITLGREGKPEEIANAVLFLASDLSSYITGQTIRVDGGIA